MKNRHYRIHTISPPKLFSAIHTYLFLSRRIDATLLGVRNVLVRSLACDIGVRTITGERFFYSFIKGLAEAEIID